MSRRYLSHIKENLSGLYIPSLHPVSVGLNSALTGVYVSALTPTKDFTCLKAAA